MNEKIILLLIAFNLYASHTVIDVYASKCDRIPESSSSPKSPPDGRFRLRIINEPNRYIPGEIYNSKHE
jgi:hypothetical protein